MSFYQIQSHIAILQYIVIHLNTKCNTTALTHIIQLTYVHTFYRSDQFRFIIPLYFIFWSGLILSIVFCMGASKTNGCVWPAHTWFLKITSVQESLYACLRVCPSPRLPLTSGIMWRNMDPTGLVKQALRLYICYTVVDLI